MSDAPPAEAYLGFAWAYDEALGRVFHDNLWPVLDEVFDTHGAVGGTCLDLACGTALAAEYLARRGFSAVGLDASVSMLDVARARQRTIVCGDMRAIPLDAGFDLVTALYDSLNHILEPDDLGRVFDGVRRLLAPEGLFVFDVNHLHAFEDVWGSDEPYRSSGDDHEVVMWTKFEREAGLGEARIRGWTRRRKARMKIDETRRQRAWGEGELVAAVENAGMKVVDVVHFDPFPHPGAGGRNVKLIFVIRRSEDSGSISEVEQ